MINTFFYHQNKGFKPLTTVACLIVRLTRLLNKVIKINSKGSRRLLNAFLRSGVYLGLYKKLKWRLMLKEWRRVMGGGFWYVMGGMYWKLLVGLIGLVRVLICTLQEPPYAHIFVPPVNSMGGTFRRSQTLSNALERFQVYSMGVSALKRSYAPGKALCEHSMLMV